MTVPAGKTPISFLQELCTKRGITPQYDLLANEGAVHEPMFIMRVSVGEILATGKGTSKKKAKHNAAQSALNMILGGSNGLPPEETPAVQAEPSASQEGEDGETGNPIGELQEFTQKNQLKPPVYEFITEPGPPHNREFICIVKLGKFTERGTGRSKKAAKRKAASCMVGQIKKIVQEAETNTTLEESEEEDEMSLSASELKVAYKMLKENKKKIPVPNPQQTKEIERFCEQILKGKGSQKLKSQSMNAPTTNYCQMLQEIAEVQRFEVSYMDIGELSITGQHQCLVQLSTLPIAVCHGTGNSVDESHAHAAHNALQYLKLIIKS